MKSGCLYIASINEDAFSDGSCLICQCNIGFKLSKFLKILKFREMDVVCRVFVIVNISSEMNFW